MYNFFSQKNIVTKDKDIIIYPFIVNESQKKAIRAALSNSHSIIQGPPGTGKTDSILNIIANLIIRGKSSAIVSSSNKAIKNVIEKLEEQDYNFVVAMLGNSDNKTDFFNNQSSYPKCLKEWKCSRIKFKFLRLKIKILDILSIKFLKIENDLGVITQKLKEFKNEYSHFKDYDVEQDKVKLKWYIKSPRKILTLLLELNYQNVNDYNIFKKAYFVIKYGIFNLEQFERATEIISWLEAERYRRQKHALERKKSRLI